MNLGPAVCRVHLPSLAGALRLHSRFVRFSETRRLFSQSRPWNRFKRCAQAEEAHQFARTVANDAAAMGKGKREKDERNKARMSQRGHSMSYLQVLGIGTDIGDSVASVGLFFNNHRFLFNCGEGFQRYCLEHRVRLSKIDTVALTRVSPEATGGIPGTMLTLAGQPSTAGFRLVGPRPLATLMGGFDRFVATKDLQVEYSELPPTVPTQQGEAVGAGGSAGGGADAGAGGSEGGNGDARMGGVAPRSQPCMWGPTVDSNARVTLRAVVVFSDRAVGNNDTETPTAATGGGEGAGREVGVEGSGSGGAEGRVTKRARLGMGPPMRGSWVEEARDGVAMLGRETCFEAACYVLELADAPGKFLPDKARALGVTMGPDCGRLVMGESVVGAGGVMVHPSQVMEPDVPGPVCLVVDCPDASFIDSLVTGEVWSEYQERQMGGVGGGVGAGEGNGVGAGVGEGEGLKGGPGSKAGKVLCVVHLAPESVVSDPRYLAWRSCFPTAAHHITVNPSACHHAPVLRSSANLMARLAALDSQIFANHFNAGVEGEGVGVGDVKGEGGEVAGRNLLKLWLLPADRKGRFELPTDGQGGAEGEGVGGDEGAVQRAAAVGGVGVAGAGVAGAAAAVGQGSQGHQPPRLGFGSPQVMSGSESGSVASGGEEGGEVTGAGSSAGAGVTAGSSAGAGVTAGGSAAAGVTAGGSGSAVGGAVRKGKALKRRGWAKAVADYPGLDDDSLEITFLGTGAACPSKYRNVSAILLRRTGPTPAALLLDAGEGTYGQLVRRFGIAGAEEVVRSIRGVWLSHVHADHHIGVRRVLQRRVELLGEEAARENPCLVIAPRPLRDVLGAYAQLETLACRYLDATATEQRPPPIRVGTATATATTTLTTTTPTASPALSPLLTSMGLSRLESVRVVHCRDAFACVVEGQAGWKVVYSGDTRPCDAVVDAARNATLLIHEATFEDQLRDEAINKRHSTTGEAVSVGARAGVYRTLLTHFSQRYPRIPVINKSYRHNTCIAFDLMTIRFRDLPGLPDLVPRLKRVFEDSIPGDDKEGEDVAVPFSATD